MVPMSRNNPTHSRLVARIGGILDAYSIRTTFGEVYAGDVAVITKRDPDTGRGADVAVASHETLKDQPPNAAALQVAPELIIEVVSPSNLWDEIMTELWEYFGIGVKHVWIVTPSTQTLQDYTSITEMSGYSLAESRQGKCPDILPDFELDLREIFGESS